MNGRERGKRKTVKLSSLVETITHAPMPLMQWAGSQRVKNLNIGNMRADPTVSPQPNEIGEDGRVKAGSGVAPGTPKMALLMTHLTCGVASYPLHLKPHSMKHQRTLKSYGHTPHRPLSRMQWEVPIPQCHGMIR